MNHSASRAVYVTGLYAAEENMQMRSEARINLNSKKLKILGKKILTHNQTNSYKS